MISLNHVLRGLQPVGWLLLPLVLASLFWSGVQWLDPQPQTPVTAANKPIQVLWINQLERYWQQPDQVAAPVRPVAPISRLAVQIQGVFLSDQVGRSVVLLKYRNKDRTLSAGDELDAGIRLVEIRSDALVFDRNGQLEQVPLQLADQPVRQQGISAQQRTADLSDARQTAPQPRTSPQPQTSRQERVGTRVLEDAFGADFRTNLLRDPLQLMRYITLAPHHDAGQLQGFRLNPGSDASLFNSLGLQAGDLLVSVDGVPVSDTAQMMALTTRLQSASAVDLELLRGNERLIFSLEME